MGGVSGLTRRASVAVIGAGPGGLGAAKAAMDHGLKPAVFEQGSTYGGAWGPAKKLTWDGMRTNVSHHTCRFSDFPWKDTSEDFPASKAVHAYLGQYIDHFKLHSSLRLNTTVTELKNKGDGWQIRWSNKQGISQKEIFDHVIVATGIFTTPHIPSIKNSHLFKGTMLHSKDYNSPEAFKNKRVIVVGNSFSGAEIAAEIATTAKQAINVMRQPYWVVPRYIPKPLQSTEHRFPLDLVFYKRAADAPVLTPAEANRRKNAYLSQLCGDQGAICEALRIDPTSSAPPRVIVSDSYLPAIKEGRLTVKQATIGALTTHTMQFTDGSEIEADVIVFATGHQLALPFFDAAMQKTLEFSPSDLLQPLILSQSTVHPSLPNLAFVGLYRGPYFAAMELQARWACAMFSGKVPPPSPEQMQKELESARAIREQNPRPQFPNSDYVRFADTLAQASRVSPAWEDIEKEDPVLYGILSSAPVTPAQYRLTGFASKPDQAVEQIKKAHSAAMRPAALCSMA